MRCWTAPARSGWWAASTRRVIPGRAPSGRAAYTFEVDQDGLWQIEISGGEGGGKKLAQGKAAFALGKWHRLALRFEGPSIQASIDGASVASVKDDTRKSGLAAFGCGWHKAQFDNLRIER